MPWSRPCARAEILRRSMTRAGRRGRSWTRRDARVASLVGALTTETIFTSGGTEANNLALSGAGRRRVLVSAIEHDSVRRGVPHAEILPVDSDGVLDLVALDATLAASSEPVLVSVMLANNETGVLQPIAEVARLARAAGALVHCDAVHGGRQGPGRPAGSRCRLPQSFRPQARRPGRRWCARRAQWRTVLSGPARWRAGIQPSRRHGERGGHRGLRVQRPRLLAAVSTSRECAINLNFLSSRSRPAQRCSAYGCLE